MSRPLMSFQPTSHCYEQGRGTGNAIVLVHIMSLRFVDVKQNINTQSDLRFVGTGGTGGPVKFFLSV